jgi:hypothetical protein
VGDVPVLDADRRPAADVVADAEAAPRGFQHHHMGRRIVVGLAERVDQFVLELLADGVELVGPVERDDADFVVGLVAN